MTEFIKILLYTVLAIIGVCLIIPLLCVIIGWSAPYFNQFFILLGNNPIILGIFVIAIVIIIMKLIIDNF